MRERILVAVLCVLISSAGSAAASKPPELEDWIEANAPFGAGSLTWFVFTAYDASLWTDAREWTMAEPFALSLHYAMSFTTQELVERTLEEMARVAPGSDPLRYGAVLEKAFPPVAGGDRITALHLPAEGVRFFHNGVATATVNDPEFSERFFAIWLSEETAARDLRVRLLGIDRSSP